MFTFVTFVRNSGGLSLTSMTWIIISGEVVNKGGSPWSVHLTLIYI